MRNFCQPTRTNLSLKLFSTKCKWFGKFRDSLFVYKKIFHTTKIDLYFAVENGPAKLRVAGVSIDEMFCAICNI